jgi:enamine deaminase RidA (YjgF/YER057c/UK114 family)
LTESPGSPIIEPRVTPSTLGDERVPVYLCRPEDAIKTNDCSTVLRRFTGPEAFELSVLCRPEGGTTDVARQAEAVYRALLDVLTSEGASFEAVASETVFLRNVREDLKVVLDSRSRVLEEAGLPSRRPVTTSVEQPPLNEGACLELSVAAVIPRRQQTWSACNVWATPACGCEACARSCARLVRVADETYFHAGNMYGAGGSAFEEAYALFCSAEDLLQEGGMSFRDVVRTWIYLRDIDRDYADLNRARREFFRRRGIDVRPASTGVGGGPFPDGHDFSISLYAVKSPRPLDVELMSAPTLSEPWTYGSDFSRGLKVVEANKIGLYVSGTASVDEAGRTVHVGNFEAQVDRTLINISSLLAAHGASFRNLVSAVTYLKHPSDAQPLRALFHKHGFDGFPSALVEAPICRPDLLCETEAVAVLPLPQAHT